MDTSQKLVVITKEMAADLAAQQLVTLGELGAIELSLALGRAVGPEETEGFNYGSPYIMSRVRLVRGLMPRARDR